MKDINQIMAKSFHYGNLSLLEHTQHVVTAIEKFVDGFEFPFDKSIAIKGAILHDLGKAHPIFQDKLNGINNKKIIEEVVHRHEISSLAFLSSFPKDEWNDLIDLVVGHHKSILNDKKKRGILDIKTHHRDWIDVHLQDFEDWSNYAYQILNYFHIEYNKITKKEAIESLKYVVQYCEDKGNNWSAHRGLLMASDHLASAFMGRTNEITNNLFTIPNLSYFNDTNRQSEIYPLSKVNTNINKKHTLVVAPTGAGKTDFLIKRCQGRIFYTLPYQASINSMFDRLSYAIKSIQPEADIRLLHSISKIVISKDYEKRIDEQILQPLSGASIKVLTPHQMSAMIFGTKGYETIMLDVMGCDIILDEIHTYSDVSQSMVIEIVKTLIRLNCRIHIGTATMPQKLYDILLDTLGGKDEVFEYKLDDDILNTFNRHKIFKITNEDVDSIIEKAIQNNEKLLVIFNTIKQAQENFKRFDENTKYSEIPKMLIHSRFRRKDRVRLEKELTDYYNNLETACVVFSTQVVEVSLDISFDRMITECAPIDSLIQRFGRVNRKRNKETIGVYKPIHIIEPKGSTLPYRSDIINRSFDILPNNGEIMKETEIQSKIDYVYPEIDFQTIDSHLIYKNGKYTIKELTNQKKAVLVEILEIESASCILESDKGLYENSDWENRVNLEIPINYNTIKYSKNKYEQLDYGNNPFVIPQDEESHIKYGLELIENANIF